MWTLTCSSWVCHHAAALARRSLLSELFRATPLGILLAALKSPPRKAHEALTRKRTKR